MNEAESQNAERFVELLEQVALEPADPDGHRKLSVLAFSYERAEPDGTTTRQSVEVPILQLLPIGGISIEHARLNYALKVSPSAKKKKGALRFFGRIAESAKSETKLSGNFDIELNLRQIDLPQGVLSLLESSQNAVKQQEITATPAVEAIPDEFVEIELVEMTPQSLVAGQDHKLTLKVGLAPALAERRSEVRLIFSATPRSALQFPEFNDITISEHLRFELPFTASSEIGGFKETTLVGLVVDATVKAPSGSPKSLRRSFQLPRDPDGGTSGGECK